MRQVAIVLIFNDKKEILLCMKKRGFGAGKWNGAGGKQEDDEPIIQTALRELNEETGIDLDKSDIKEAGILYFYWPHNPDWNQKATIFISENFNGNANETEEMRPEWFTSDSIPYSEMWEADSIWLPRLINGEFPKYEFHYDEKGLLKESKQIV